MRSHGLSAAAVLLSTFLSALDAFPSCPGLIKHPEPRKEAWVSKFAAQLAREVREADAGQGFELVFYGDSITEEWRGTDQGRFCARCFQTSSVFDKFFGQYRSDVLAVGGDQVSHLFWRLMHGDIPRIHLPKVAVTMIGINDLGAAAICSDGDDNVITQAADGVIHRLRDTIDFLRKELPSTRLVLLGVLPRGDGKTAETKYEWPGRYTPAIGKINKWLRETAENSAQLTYLDCGQGLLVDGKIVPGLQADGLHPTVAGMEVLGRCISPVVDKLMSSVSIAKLQHLHVT